MFWNLMAVIPDTFSLPYSHISVIFKISRKFLATCLMFLHMRDSYVSMICEMLGAKVVFAYCISMHVTARFGYCSMLLCLHADLN